VGWPTIEPMFESLVDAVAAYRAADAERWAAVRGEATALERTHFVLEELRAGGYLELIRLLAMESATGSSPKAHARYVAQVDRLVEESDQSSWGSASG
jgi:hypothetical protein